MSNEENCSGCAGCGSASEGEIAAFTVERGITRRVFLERGALAAAAVMLASCVASDSTGPNLSGKTTIDVSSYAALANVGGVALVSIEGSPFAIVRTGATSFLALSRICPHQGGLIVTTSTGFRCTEHGATFSSTGTWTGGQRTSSMRSYPTSYDAATSTLTVG
jgi:Rieske Fe-S protein